VADSITAFVRLHLAEPETGVEFDHTLHEKLKGDGLHGIAQGTNSSNAPEEGLPCPMRRFRANPFIAPRQFFARRRDAMTYRHSDGSPRWPARHRASRPEVPNEIDVLWEWGALSLGGIGRTLFVHLRFLKAAAVFPAFVEVVVDIGHGVLPAGHY